MAGYVARRLLTTVGLLWAMSVLIFGIVHLLPGNVAYAILGEFALPDAVALLQRQLGLNDPLVVQYGRWLGGILRGDFGLSLTINRPAMPWSFP